MEEVSPNIQTKNAHNFILPSKFIKQNKPSFRSSILKNIPIMNLNNDTEDIDDLKNSTRKKSPKIKYFSITRS